MNYKEENTMSGKPKLLFTCLVCNFSGKTSGFPKSCPACRFNPLAEINKQREVEESNL